MSDTSKTLVDAIRATTELQGDGILFEATDIAQAVIMRLATDSAKEWLELRDTIVMKVIVNAVRHEMRRTIARTDARQQALPLEGFEHVPQFIELDGAWVNLRSATLEQYRRYRTSFEAKLSSYNYARRSEARMKRDKETLREMLRLDRKLAPYFAGNPDMTIGQATELHLADLNTPKAEHNRTIAKSGGSAKRRRT
ncbi:MAG TPA: hypothetical protein VER03_19410 [Bryobacteraceae bacterium]|nr:hypothetical protein [Bryobacteraceae bacterium]